MLWLAAGGKSFFVTFAGLLGSSSGTAGSIIVVIAPLKAQVAEQVSKANALFRSAGSTATAVDLSGDNRPEHSDELNKLLLRANIRLVYSASLISLICCLCHVRHDNRRCHSVINPRIDQYSCFKRPAALMCSDARDAAVAAAAQSAGAAVDARPTGGHCCRRCARCGGVGPLVQVEQR